MSSQSVDDAASRFFTIKTGALLHDPPIKMFAIKEHEEIAKRFQSKILEGIRSLKIEYITRYSRIIKKSDIASSTFDRWFLPPINKSEYIINYSVLHNIFDPRYRYELKSFGMDELINFTNRVAERINSILKTIDELKELEEIEGGWYKRWLLYTLLYVLFEIVWYGQDGKIPISLADTRTPTHTVFDHVYASSTIANLFFKYSDEKELKPSGYIVKIDIPGIQEFISSSRKAGDLWASSWLLSQLMWKIVWRIVSQLGPDTLVLPSPRLNPYLINSIYRELNRISEEMRKKLEIMNDKRVGQSIENLINNIRSIINDLINYYENVLNKIIPGISVLGLGRDLIERLNYISIIPATAILVLPRIGIRDLDFTTIDKVKDTILKVYLDSWNELINKLNIELSRVIDEDERKIIESLYNFIKKHIEIPYTGLRINIVDLEKLYYEINECLSEGSDDTCIELGITNYQKLGELVRDIVKKYRVSIEDIALRILWHIAFTCKLNNPDERVIATPRTFWFEENNEGLKGVIEELKRNWIPCSLCGKEPAIIKLGKREIAGEIDYDDKDLHNFLNNIGLKEYIGNESIKQKLKLFFKPGEALGPYCLMKRLIYMIYRVEIKSLIPKGYLKDKFIELSGVATDDIALSLLDLALDRLVGSDELLKGFIDYMNKKFKFNRQQLSSQGVSIDDVRSILKWIFPITLGEEIPNRDISRACYELNILLTNLGLTYKISYDRFVDLMSEFIEQLFTMLVAKKNDFERSWSLLIEFISILLRDRDIVEKSMKIVKDILDEMGSKGVNIGWNIVRGSLRRFCKLRTHYVIVRGDADNMGRLINGKLPLSVKEYLLEKLLEDIKRNSKIDGDKKKALEDLEKSYTIALKIANYINNYDERIIISPTFTTQLSESLMISSIKDVYEVGKRVGFTVFSGGDDVLALLPVETLISAVVGMRQVFDGDNHFIVLSCKGYRAPILSIPLTGRSFSARITNLMDIMIHEIIEASHYLEEYAKNTKWVVNGYEWAKDTFIVTDSRSQTTTILPLRKITGETYTYKEIYHEILLPIWLYIKQGLLSSGLPEDIMNYLQGIGSKQLVIREESILRKFNELVLRRNIFAKDLEKIVDEISKYIDAHDIYKVKCISKSEIPLLINLYMFLKILRRYP